MHYQWVDSAPTIAELLATLSLFLFTVVPSVDFELILKKNYLVESLQRLGLGIGFFDSGSVHPSAFICIFFGFYVVLLELMKT